MSTFMATTTVYTYSANTDSDFIRLASEYDSWKDAVEDAAEAEENCFELAKMLHSEEVGIDFLQHHRVIFFDDDGHGDALGINVPKIDEPTKYRLYIGMLGDDLFFADESEDYKLMANRFENAVDKAHKIMSIIDESMSNECKNNFRGVIISTTDRNFIKIL